MGVPVQALAAVANSVPVIMDIIAKAPPLYRDVAVQINNFTNGMITLSDGPYLAHGLYCGGKQGVPQVPSIPPNMSAAWLFEKAAGSAYGPQGAICFTLQYYDQDENFNTEEFAVLFRIPDASSINWYYWVENQSSAEDTWKTYNGKMWNAKTQGTYQTTIGPNGEFAVYISMETTNDAVMSITIYPPSLDNPAFELTCSAGTAGPGTTIVLPDGTAGVEYPTYTISVDLPGGEYYEVEPYTWSPNGLPAWLQINPNASDSSQGVLSANGTPTAGTYNFTVNATDGGACPASSGDVPFQIVINKG